MNERIAAFGGESLVNVHLAAFGGEFLVNARLAAFGGESLVNACLAALRVPKPAFRGGATKIYEPLP